MSPATSGYPGLQPWAAAERGGLGGSPDRGALLSPLRQPSPFPWRGGCREAQAPLQSSPTRRALLRFPSRLATHQPATSQPRALRFHPSVMSAHSISPPKPSILVTTALPRHGYFLTRIQSELLSIAMPPSWTFLEPLTFPEIESMKEEGWNLS